MQVNKSMLKWDSIHLHPKIATQMVNDYMILQMTINFFFQVSGISDQHAHPENKT